MTSQEVSNWVKLPSQEGRQKKEAASKKLDDSTEDITGHDWTHRLCNVLITGKFKNGSFDFKYPGRTLQSYLLLFVLFLIMLNYLNTRNIRR